MDAVLITIQIAKYGMPKIFYNNTSKSFCVMCGIGIVMQCDQKIYKVIK